MKIAILGAGKMGGALAIGIAREKKAGIFVCDHSQEKAKRVAKACGGKAVGAKEATEKADIVIVAVKPDAVDGLLAQIASVLSGKLLLSIAAGIPIPYLKKKVPKNCRVAVAMPNLAVENGSGATVYFAKNGKDAKLIEKILSPTGIVIRAKTEDDVIFGMLTGSGIAFFYSAIEGMARAGVMHGMKYSDAILLAASAAKGAGSLVLHKKAEPMALEKMVATKKGVTLHGLRVLRKAKITRHFHRAAHAVILETKRRRKNNR